MRANHASDAQEPVRGIGGTSRTAGGWLPRPRTLAAGGALIAQVWGLGLSAPAAYAATADPIVVPAGRAVRPLHHGPADNGPADNEPGANGPAGSGPTGNGSADAGPAGDRPAGPPKAPAERKQGGAPAGSPGSPGQAASPGLLGELTGSAAAVVPVPALTEPGAAVGDTLQDRIKAGGLPLPGQGAAVPDAFAIASGLLSAVPAQGRPTAPRASRDTGPGTADAQGRSEGGQVDDRGSGAGAPRGPAAPPPARTAADRPNAAPAGYSGASGSGGPAGGRGAGSGAGSADGSAVPAQRASEQDLDRLDAAALPVAHGTAGTGTAVVVPIAAGLLLTGAAMYKHRGLPRGH